MDVFAIAARKLTWLSARSGAVASNIANADTPAFRARDVYPFESLLQNDVVKLATTNKRHLASADLETAQIPSNAAAHQVIKHSGNSVSLEDELAKIGEIRSQHSLATGLVSSFHRMFMQSAKG